MAETRSLFAEDTAAHQVAASLGFSLVRRYRAIEITDEKLVIAAGYAITKPKPDFAKIAAALDEGLFVPGAQWRGMEYVLRPAVEAAQ